MQKYCLALDLKNDATLIAEYEQYHKRIPDAIDKSIRDAGVKNLEIGTGINLLLCFDILGEYRYHSKREYNDGSHNQQFYALDLKDISLGFMFHKFSTFKIVSFSFVDQIRSSEPQEFKAIKKFNKALCNSFILC